jgi:hypothetical protein
MTEEVHSCSYYCEHPECIRAQRDELRDRCCDVNPTLWLGALRYYSFGGTGRSVRDFCALLIRQWPKFDERLKLGIKQFVEESFTEDDKGRQSDVQYRRLGTDCDRAEWECVRGLWK